jgi:hypothetical protein
VLDIHDSLRVFKIIHRGKAPGPQGVCPPVNVRKVAMAGGWWLRYPMNPEIG